MLVPSDHFREQADPRLAHGWRQETMGVSLEGYQGAGQHRQTQIHQAAAVRQWSPRGLRRRQHERGDVNQNPERFQALRGISRDQVQCASSASPQATVDAVKEQQTGGPLAQVQ